jgi:hypothetical protein
MGVERRLLGVERRAFEAANTLVNNVASGKRKERPTLCKKTEHKKTEQQRVGHPGIKWRPPAHIQLMLRVCHPPAALAWSRSASGGGLEPLDRSAQRGSLSVAHRGLQPHHRATPGNRPAVGTALLGLRQVNRWFFLRHKPIGADISEGSVLGGNRRGTLADRSCERQL